MTAMKRTFRNWGGRPWWFWRRLANRKARWTPNELSGSILAWWDAGAGITVTGAGVSSWVDRKGGYELVQATDANRPAYSATGFNGSPGLTFDGTADYLSMESQPFPSGASPCEVWAVVQQDALAADTTTRQVVSYGGVVTNDRRAIVRFVSGGFNLISAQAGDGAANKSSTAPGTASSRHVVRGVFEADGITGHMDGSAGTKTAGVPATGTTRFRVGASSANTPANFWNGKVRDVIVTGLLSTDDAAELSAYLLARRNV